MFQMKQQQLLQQQLLEEQFQLTKQRLQSQHEQQLTNLLQVNDNTKGGKSDNCVTLMCLAAGATAQGGGCCCPGAAGPPGQAGHTQAEGQDQPVRRGVT